MTQATKSYIKAVSAIVGTTIGVGIFGVPYAIYQAGPALGFVYILGIGSLLVALNLLLGEVVLRTRDKKRFVGIARTYLSKNGAIFTSVISIFSFWASLLAYIIVGGQFLHIIFAEFGGFSGTETDFSILFFIVGSLLILGGISYISEAEFFMVLLLFVTMAVILVSGIPLIDLANYNNFSTEHFFLPFGVVLFALGSASAIPFVEDVLDQNKKAMRRSILLGGIISVLFTLIFAAVIVGVTGGATTEEAIRGLVGVLGNNVVLLGAIFGFFALITSYIVIGEHLTNIFRYDLKISKYFAWFTATGLPLMLFLFATNNFITVIDIAGGVFGALLSIVIAYIYLKAREKKTRQPEYVVKYGTFWAYALIAVFGIGFLYQLYYSTCQCF